MYKITDEEKEALKELLAERSEIYEVKQNHVVLGVNNFKLKVGETCVINPNCYDKIKNFPYKMMYSKINLEEIIWLDSEGNKGFVYDTNILSMEFNSNYWIKLEI